jgi:hypothetical protein
MPCIIGAKTTLAKRVCAVRSEQHDIQCSEICVYWRVTSKCNFVFVVLY